MSDTRITYEAQGGEETVFVLFPDNREKLGGEVVAAHPLFFKGDSIELLREISEWGMDYPLLVTFQELGKDQRWSFHRFVPGTR